MKVESVVIRVSHEGEIYHVHCHEYGGIKNVFAKTGERIKSESSLYRDIVFHTGVVRGRLSKAPNLFGETGKMAKERAMAFKRK